MSNVQSGYGEDSISSLKGADRIRKRPGAVLGSAGVEGAYHTFTEIVGNSMDEVRAGFGTKVEITRHADGSITVSDTGRGVPMGWNEKEGRYNWDLIFNELYAGGKYDDDNPNYEFSLGLNGLGAASTQYSSEFFTVVSRREDGVYTKYFHRGIPDDMEPAIYEENTTGETGTRITWRPDSTVFTSTNITSAMLKKPLESQAHLNKVVIVFNDEATGESITYEGKGIIEYLKQKVGDHLLEMFEYSTTSEGVENDKKYKAKIDVVLAITEDSRSHVMHHHNTGVMTTGYHGQAYDSAITDFFKSIGKQYGVNVLPMDYDGYISAITSTYASVNATSFKNQTKDGVDNKYIYDMVYFAIKDILEDAHARKRPSMEALVQNVVNAATARQRAKELEAQQRLALKANGKRREKAEKFVDCQTKDTARRELFIVEGDSAKGSCKEARESEYQAILPIKGKPINGLKAELEALLSNQEVKDIIGTLGCGVDTGLVSTFDIDKLEWSKVIITTDADIDGQQIRVLLYTIFYRLMPGLLREGKIYVAETPLFELVINDDLSWFAYDVAERDVLLEKARTEGIKIRKINRSKGLGQNNPDMLWATTMNPETRRLVQLKVDISEQLIQDISNMLFGEDPGNERKGFVFDLLEAKMGEEVGLADLVETITAMDADELAQLGMESEEPEAV